MMQKRRRLGRIGFWLLGGLLTAIVPVAAQTTDDYRELRERMVKEFIEREGITNQRVLASMRQVPRHEFVPAEIRKDAYVDAAFPIGHKQTISPPYIVAYMTQTIDPQPNDRVLEIGTGSGYQAAVLSNLVKEVYSIEILEPLGKDAAKRLKRLKYNNVKTMIGDGYKGWTEHAPFDKIIVTCSPENVPQPLIEQLKEGGRLLVPLGERYQQAFHQFEKVNGKLEEKTLVQTLFVPMTGQSEDERKVKPDPLNPHLLNGDFEQDADADGSADHWHYQRMNKLVKDPKGTEGHQRYMVFESDEHDRMSQALQATAVDGSKINALLIHCRVKTQNVVMGVDPRDSAGLVIHYYDANRKPIDQAIVGPWFGTDDWTMINKTVKVPQKAREMVVRIGLNGATGQLSVDDLTITPKAR